MPRTLSYLQHIACRPASNLPLLQPPRALLWRRQVATPQDIVSETTPALSAKHPPAVSSGQDVGIPSLHILAQHATEQPSTSPMEKAAEVLLKVGSLPSEASWSTRKDDIKVEVGLETGPLPASQLSRTHSHSISATIPSVIEDKTDNELVSRIQKLQTEIYDKPVKQVKPMDGIASGADQILLPARSHAIPQGKATSQEQHSSVTLRPNARHESRAPMTTNASMRDSHADETIHSESDVVSMGPTRHTQVTLVPQAQDRVAMPSSKRETQQRSRIYIGTIDIHIMPLPTPSTPTVPSPMVRTMSPRPPAVSALSREFTSSVGLRQG